MENFIVSALKYRPKTFDSVVGQSSITTTLKNAIKNNHLAQAFLFCGPRGVGKTTCARILAKAINCEHINDNVEACDKCESCTSFNRSHSFNIHELDAASNNSVDDIRNLIEQVRLVPQVGKYSVYIIDEVHMLSPGAFNAFLKTLEEPPAHAKFILATTSKQKIIPTILSRCQIFDFNRIQVSDIAKQLDFVAGNEGITAESDALHIIAQKADGSLRDALSIFDQLVSFAGDNITYTIVIHNLNILDYDYYFNIVRSIQEHDIPACLLIFDEILNNGFDGHNFITGLAEHLRNLLVCKDTATLQLLHVGGNIKNKYKEQAEKCSQEFLLSSLDIISNCDVQYANSRNTRLHVELALMKLCSMDSHFNFNQKKTITEPVKKIEEPKTNYQTRKTTTSLKSEVKPSEFKAQTTSIHSKTSDPKNSIEDVVKEDPPTYIAPKEEPKVQPSPSGEEKESLPTDPQSKEKQGASQINIGQLEKAWAEYAQKVQQKGKHSLFSTLTKRKPVLSRQVPETPGMTESGASPENTGKFSGKTNLIELTIDNRVQEDEVHAEKIELLQFLREKLGIQNIQILTVINKDQGEKKLYTPHDKFRRMAEKNPAILKLKQQLNLDID
ncbi:MAG: DNA polymerase III subunit gamma/tau [Bacteroidota bacterium]